MPVPEHDELPRSAMSLFPKPTPVFEEALSIPDALPLRPPKPERPTFYRATAGLTARHPPRPAMLALEALSPRLITIADLRSRLLVGAFTPVALGQKLY